ncbi:hypothetical protein BLNAU_25086 [Blattamonas nauphoetae]|uniref:Uncharacterized protein n=1 Tax=Blattamonas nauphoetae TaxID=2049346 RepID=A0ABQ9WL04_9EUKA|nr:hypothetical protein BLNAU_25086 [Blattamonas nauphoetae]
MTLNCRKDFGQKESLLKTERGRLRLWLFHNFDGLEQHGIVSSTTKANRKGAGIREPFGNCSDRALSSEESVWNQTVRVSMAGRGRRAGGEFVRSAEDEWEDL